MEPRWNENICIFLFYVHFRGFILNLKPRLHSEACGYVHGGYISVDIRSSLAH